MSSPLQDSNSRTGGRSAPGGARGLRRALKVSVGVTVTVGAVLLLDLLGGPRLPQSVRPLLPIVLALALCTALVLGVGALGAPRKPVDR